MLERSVRLLAVAALLCAAPADATEGSVIFGASWGKATYPTDQYDWEGGNTNRLMVGYDVGDVPVFFEFARLESDASRYSGRCPTGFACGGPDIYFRRFSAWQLAAGYHLWTHRNTGSAVSVRAGLYDANSTLGGSSSGTYSNAGPFLGISGTWMLTPVIGVRVEWEHLNGLDDIEPYAVSQVMAGAVVKFGGYAPFNP
jgi:hypothetical protein